MLKVLQAGETMIPDGNSELQKRMKSTENVKCESICNRHFIFPTILKNHITI
jgi:hypothetical protein